jgi:caffeoyl-CoA O-methyltransferase
MDYIIPQPIEDYARAHSTPASPLLAELEAYTHAHRDDAQMLIGPLEGALLKLLIAVVGARRVLEIGLFTGYSALTMAEALPADGKIVSCDINPRTTAIARRFFGRSPHGGKIDIRLDSGLDTLRSLQGGPAFDLVFLDADKENYPGYYDLALPLLRAGGLLVADNALWSGRVLAPQSDSDRALAAFNTKVQRDPAVDNVLLTVRDGLMVVRKK